MKGMIKQMKPVIGITTFLENKPKKVYSLVSYNYVKSVHLAGGIPLLIPLIGTEEDVKYYLDSVDALLFSGGEDVTPLTYGEDPLKEVKHTSPERDELEILLYKEALKRHIPILGICRGLQIINVAAGGTLYQDINSQIKNSLGHCPIENPVHNLYHSVAIDKNSKLSKIFETTELKVNSFHHQSVKDIGIDFKATAFSSDGIVEAIEYEGDSYVVAVQWHPEDLTIHHPHFVKLFKALVDEADKAASKK